MRRKCKKCEIEKDLNKFYDKKNGLYGKHSYCKSCMKSTNKDYRARNSDKIAIRNSLYRSKLAEKYYDPSYRSTIRLPERSLLGFEKYAEKKMKCLAGSLLNYGIRIGFVEKSSICTICKKEGEIEGHHPDYSKPLEVVWVCVECHSKFHTESIR